MGCAAHAKLTGLQLVPGVAVPVVGVGALASGSWLRVGRGCGAGACPCVCACADSRQATTRWLTIYKRSNFLWYCLQLFQQLNLSTSIYAPHLEPVHRRHLARPVRRNMRSDNVYDFRTCFRLGPTTDVDRTVVRQNPVDNSRYLN